ncbi:MAG: hypothetical protein CMJ70_08675 [Planctomycetaceae bacterium]|nr:hypothetical protein [Planctomycetaceae bacterium]HAA73397.1 hypothetical protein [Planctomycetaceae bacterium]
MQGTRRQRGERRRRLLIEEGDHSPSLAGGQSPQPSSPRKMTPRTEFGNYTDDALAERQPRLCDLIPWRVATLVCLLFGGVVLIVAVEFLFIRLGQQPGIYSPDQLRPFDPGATGSLASWVGSGFLMLTAFLAVQVYLLRRHRHDDYRGYYRRWLWVAAVLVVGSLDATTGLHQLLPPAMRVLTGIAVYGDGTIWWLLVASAVIAACTFRSVLELRYSALATIAFGIAMTGYAWAALMLLGLVSAPQEFDQVVMASASVLSGHFGLLMSLACYSRHVYLDAQGMGKRPRREEPSSETVEQDVESSAPAALPDVLAFPSSADEQASTVAVEDSAADASPQIEEAEDALAVDAAGEEDDTTADLIDELAGESSPPRQRLSKSERRRRRKQRRRKAA